MRDDGPLDQVRLLRTGREAVKHLRVEDPLFFLLLAEGVAGAALLVPGGIAVTLALVLALDPQGFAAGLAAARAGVRDVAVVGAPQVALRVIELVEPEAPRPTLGPADAEVSTQKCVGGYDLRKVGKSGFELAILRAITSISDSPVDKVGMSDAIASGVISSMRSPSTVSDQR